MPSDTHPWIDADTLEAVEAALAHAELATDSEASGLLSLALRAGGEANAGRTSQARLALAPVLEGSTEPAALFLCFQLWFRTAVAPGTQAPERTQGLRVAERAVRRRIALATASAGSRDLGRAHTNLALVLHSMGPEHHAEAERHYRRAIECDEAIAYEPGLARDLGNLGNFCEETGRGDEAEALYLRALALARAHGLRKLAAGQLANLGDVAHSRGTGSPAAGYWREAAEVFRELGHSGVVSELQRKLTELEA